MSETKATPRPWSIGKNSVQVVKHEPGRKAVLLLHCNWTPSEAASSTAPTPEMAQANARLIVAAVNSYDAREELLAAAKVGHWVADGPGCKPGCPLCAAVAKAEGRS